MRRGRARVARPPYRRATARPRGSRPRLRERGTSRRTGPRSWGDSPCPVRGASGLRVCDTRLPLRGRVLRGCLRRALLHEGCFGTSDVLLALVVGVVGFVDGSVQCLSFRA